ncbi:MAG: hypothetical protein ABI651_12675, partial [Verrucomicrobiota bacterium]
MPARPSVSLTRFVFLLLIAFALSSFPRLRGELPRARLYTVFPPGGKVGTTVEVNVTGVDLDEPTGIYFSDTNITAKPKLREGTGEPETNKFLVTIETTALPGIHEARVIGRFGISNPRSFVASDLPEIIETATNATPATAREVVLDTVVNGHIDANAADYFKFAAKKGQRLLIDCQAKDIDSRMEAVLVLFDTSGRELERNRRGGLLDFTAAADGEYLVETHDFLYRGGEEYFYRLTISAGPHIDFIFPPAGLPGTKGKYWLYGRNLPGGARANGMTIEGKPIEQLSVDIELPDDLAARMNWPFSTLRQPAAAILDGIEYRLRAPESGRLDRVSNPVILSFAKAPIVVEQEPNNKPEAAQKVSVPCEYVGQFYPQDDRDWITFDANKGDVYWIEVISQRLGLPTSPFVVIQRVTRNDKGLEQSSDVQELYAGDNNIGGDEFKTSARDPSGRFEAKEGGTYRIQVRNLFSRAEADPRLVYRLSLRRPAPDFGLVALPQPPPPVNKDKKEAILWTSFLRGGEAMPVKVLVLRRDNFNGEIQLSVEGLPPGVTCDGATIASDKNSVSIFLTAAEGAESWFGPIHIVGKAKAGDVDLNREARAGLVMWAVGDYGTEAVSSRLTSEFVLALTRREIIPITMGAAENKVWETSIAGKLKIPIEVTRRGDFNETLKIKASGLAALDALKELEVSDKTNSATLELDLTQQKIPAGNQSFYLVAQTQGKYRKETAEEVEAAEKTAKQAEKTAVELTDASKKTTESLAAATKAAEEAAGSAKAAAEKLAAAKTAAEKTISDEDLVAARTAAETESDEAAAKAKSAADARDEARKAIDEVSAKAKEAEKKKDGAAKRVKEMVARDAAVAIYSAPIKLRIAAVPIQLSVESVGTRVEQGGRVEIPISLKRLYEFNDSVELTLAPPKDVVGLKTAKVTVPKDETEVKLVFEASPDATPGEHKLTLQAKLQFNNQDLLWDQPIHL